MNERIMVEEDQTVMGHPELGTRTCPTCGARMFVDMRRCYACMSFYDEEHVPTEAYWTNAEPEPVGEGPREPVRLGVKISNEAIEVRMPVPAAGLLVGRGSSCDVVLRNRSVSRKHVRITPNGDGAIVQDEGARNPATLRGEAVAGTAHLVRGDELQVCGTTITLL